MIKNLKLENFKCFDKLELQIAPLTIITGINGMGKSSVIQSLLMLRQSFDERYLQTEDKVLLNGELVNLISGNAMRFVHSDSPTVKVLLEFDEEKIFACSIKSDSPEELLKCTKEGLNELNTISLFANSFSYLCAERLGPRAGYPVSHNKRHKGRLGLGGAELTASYLLSSLRNNAPLPISQLKHPDETSPLISQNVSAWLSEITYDGVQVRASEKTPEEVEFIYSFSKGRLKGFNFSPLHVGFGFSYVLPVITAVLSAQPGSLILIENPEAHLHPAAQSKIGKLLALAAENGVQIIIETHSDHLLNGIRVSVHQGKVNPQNTQIHFFTSDEIEQADTQYKVSFKIKENGGIERWPKGFFDEWDNNLDDLLS